MATLAATTSNNEAGRKVCFAKVDWEEEEERSRRGTIHRKRQQRKIETKQALKKEQVSMMKCCWYLLKSPKHVDHWLGLEKTDMESGAWFVEMEAFFQGIGKYHDGRPRSVYDNLEATLAWFQQEKSLVFKSHNILPLYLLSESFLFEREFGVTEETKQARAEYKALKERHKKNPLPPLPLEKEYGQGLLPMQSIFQHLKSSDPSHVEWWVEVFKHCEEIHDADIADEDRNSHWLQTVSLYSDLRAFLWRAGLPEEIIRLEDRLAWFRQATSVTLSEEVLTKDALFSLYSLTKNKIIQNAILEEAHQNSIDEEVEDDDVFSNGVEEREKRPRSGDNMLATRPAKKCKMASDVKALSQC